MRRFEEWWGAQDKLRRDRFYGRDFMWWDSDANGPAWGYAVTDTPADFGGYDVIGFPGGVYAVANYAPGTTESALSAYGTIKKWVETSGCFAMDEGAGRHILWNCTCPEAAFAVMGYHQYDMYVPIQARKEGEQ
jgi:hypothetical protein